MIVPVFQGLGGAESFAQSHTDPTLKHQRPSLACDSTVAHVQRPLGLVEGGQL